MNNKILVLLYVPTLDKEYTVFIPIGKTVGAIKKYMMDIISDFIDLKFTIDMNLYNKENRKVYDNNLLIRDTDIRNGTRLILI